MKMKGTNKAAASFILLIGIFQSIQADEMVTKDTLNVRTVLFKDIDSCRACWSYEDINLLLTRKLMQDLIPRKVPTNFENLATYIKTAIETVKNRATAENAQMMTLAVYDVLGGYLKAIGIPVLNEAYYAGNVQYSTAAELHCLYGRIMSYLHTDGGGWAHSCDMRKIPTKVQALTITMCNTTEACNTLEVKGNAVPACSIKDLSGDEPTRIAIPYLDDNLYPNAIAVPLKGNSLFSLMSNCSANLLPKFYILAMRCLASTCFSRKDIINFNHQLYDWIISTVVPHVHETDRWYPGFGGVMRIIETMNQRGLASQEALRPDLTPSNNTVPGFGDICDDSFLNQKWLLLAILGVILSFLLCCCMCYCFMRLCSRPTITVEDNEESNEGLTKTLVSIYCGVKESLIGGGRNQSSCVDKPRGRKEMSAYPNESKSRSSHSSAPKSKQGSRRYPSEARFYTESECSTTGVRSSTSGR